MCTGEISCYCIHALVEHSNVYSTLYIYMCDACMSAVIQDAETEGGRNWDEIYNPKFCAYNVNSYVCSMGIWVSVMGGGGGQKRGVPARKLVRHFLGNYEYCRIP